MDRFTISPAPRPAIAADLPATEAQGSDSAQFLATHKGQRALQAGRYDLPLPRRLESGAASPRRTFIAWAAQQRATKGGFLPGVAEEGAPQNAPQKTTQNVQDSTRRWSTGDLNLFRSEILPRILAKAPPAQKALIGTALWSMRQPDEEQVKALLDLALCSDKTDPRYEAAAQRLQKAIASLPNYARQGVNNAASDWLKATKTPG